MKKNQKGFTLIELIIVIAILGILAGLAVPSLIGFSDNAKKAKDEDFADTVATSAVVAYVDTGAVLTGNPLTVAGYASYFNQSTTLDHYTSITVVDAAPAGGCDTGAFEILAVTLSDGTNTYSVCK